MAFRIGQKVVCVETWFFPGRYERGPVEGAIYTIRNLGPGLNPVFPNVLQVRLCEVKNPVFIYETGTFEVAFRASRFRPVVDRKTDISFAHEILRSVTQRENV